MNILELHKSTWEALVQRRQKLPHAILLSGQRGIGKFALAKSFAAALLCEKPAADGRACTQCLACNWFAQGNHPDFRLLQPAVLAAQQKAENEAESEKNVSKEGGEEAESGRKKKASQEIVIDQVRALDEFLGVGSHRGGLSIVLVNPAEAMNRNAANAILKVLEEPPVNTLFLLVTDESSRLLPTIRSRCQSIAVGVPDRSGALAYMRANGLAEAERWLALSGGAVRLASEMAEEMSAAGGKKNASSGHWLALVLKHLEQGEGHDPLRAAAELDKLIREQKGALALRQIVEVLQKWLIDLTQAANHLPVRYFLGQSDKICALAAKMPSARLLRAYRKLAAQRREAEQPLNGRLFLEGVFLDYQSLFRSRTSE